MPHRRESVTVIDFRILLCAQRGGGYSAKRWKCSSRCGGSSLLVACCQCAVPGHDGVKALSSGSEESEEGSSDSSRLCGHWTGSPEHSSARANVANEDISD